MRTVHWLFMISVALFVAGIAFIVAAERGRRSAPKTEARPVADVRPVASVKQIMAGIVNPATMAVFDAVSTKVTKQGIEEVAPSTEAEWAALGNSGAALAEAGNLMMIDGRAIDNGD